MTVQRPIRSTERPRVLDLDDQIVDLPPADLLPVSVFAADGSGRDGQLARRLGRLTYIRGRGEGCTIVRTRADIARVQMQCLSLVVNTGSRLDWTAPLMEEAVLHSGDIALFHGDERTSGRQARLDMETWLVPLEVIDPALVDRVGGGAQMGSREARTAMVRDYMRSLVIHSDAVDPDAGEALSLHLVRLIEIAARQCPAEAVEGGAEAVASARLLRLRRLIDARLQDPLLDPPRIAALAGVSVRSLHALFAPTGESVGRYLIRRRLERVRAAIRSPGAERLSLAQLAFANGFNSLSTFHLRYHEAFGETPGATRRR